MKIEHVMIRNFRSIREMEIHFRPLMVFIGPNNHAKSNVLLALDFFFDAGAKLNLEDFFVHREPPDAAVVVEVQFCELTDQDRVTFRKYLVDGGKLKVQKIARIQNGSIVQEYHGYIETPKEPWLNPDKAGDYASRDAIAGLPEAFKSLLPSSGRITKAQVEGAQQQYIDDHRQELEFSVLLETGPFLGQRTVAAGILGDYFLVPAVRDITDETKIQGTTSFGRLLTNAIREMTERNEDFQRIREELTRLVGSLNKPPEGGQGERPRELMELELSLCEELRDWGVSLDIEITPPEIERLFQLGTRVFMDDGVRTSVECKGHGLQRCFLLALFKAWAATLNKLRTAEVIGAEVTAQLSRRAPTQSLFFAVEEPELFLHPQAQRQMLSSLKDLSTALNHQVLLCTHSSFFVDMEDYKSICVITKPSAREGSKALQCRDDLFPGEAGKERKKRFNMAYWFNPDRSEMFFARRVVLVEGPTEKTLLPFLAD